MANKFNAREYLQFIAKNIDYKTIGIEDIDTFLSSQDESQMDTISYGLDIFKVKTAVVFSYSENVFNLTIVITLPKNTSKLAIMERTNECNQIYAGCGFKFFLVEDINSNKIFVTTQDFYVNPAENDGKDDLMLYDLNAEIENLPDIYDFLKEKFKF